MQTRDHRTWGYRWISRQLEDASDVRRRIKERDLASAPCKGLGIQNQHAESDGRNEFHSPDVHKDPPAFESAVGGELGLDLRLACHIKSPHQTENAHPTVKLDMDPLLLKFPAGT